MADQDASKHIHPQRIEATSETATQTTVSIRGHEFTIDEPPQGGGDDEGPTPVETMLAAQAGCLNVVGNKVASDLNADISIRNIEIEGALDIRKVNGLAEEPRAGVQDIDVSIQIETDEDEQTIREWAELTEERCPVTDNLVEETSCEVDISVW